jgi:meiotically up-regulated gene 157 (Mug157) protein
MMAVELKRTADVIEISGGKKGLARQLREMAANIEKGIWEHGVVIHKKYGKVFAYEIDGYGSSIFMDDANLPSLLSLPLLGFVDQDDKVYQNTRKMILEKDGNPYYLRGLYFEGIGGPHSEQPYLPQQ